MGIMPNERRSFKGTLMNPALRLLALPVFVVSLTSPALAQEHDHGAPKAATAEAAKPSSKTADGKKWLTDAQLRKSMDAIRIVVQTNLPKVHGFKATDADYAAIAKQIDAEVAVIFQQCKLAPDADAALHEILLPIMDATKTLNEGTIKRFAFVKILKSVNEYGEQFDHPGWKPVAH